MKILRYFTPLLLLLALSCSEKAAKDSQNSASTKGITTKDVTYNFNGNNYKSFVAYSGESEEPRPVVMIIPEWWGLTDYAKERARQLAELGYFAMAVDYYGDGKIVETPEEATKLSTPFYQIPINAKQVFDAARARLLEFPAANHNKIAVVGYCFGGAQALNMARQESDLKGAVSFHGNLMTGIKPKNNNVPLLICNGAADTFVSAEEIAAFKKEMDSSHVKYTFIDYPDALHSFTNPASTAMGKKYDMKIAYNKAADEKSWNDMKKFLADIFK